MKILFVIDYKSWVLVQKGKMPTHHIWGMDYFIEKFITQDRAEIKSIFGGGYIDFVYYKHFFIFNAPSFLRLAQNYDIIFDPITVIYPSIGFLRKFGIKTPFMITQFHYPPFKWLMRFGKTDVALFFSQTLCKETQKYVSDSRMMQTIKWYPDVNWYLNNMHKLDTVKDIIFLDTGKNKRDKDKFVRSMKKLPSLNALIVMTGNAKTPVSYNDDSNVDIYRVESPDSVKMMSLFVRSKIMVIPLSLDIENTPIGSTNYLDAVAMGMPVVCPSNTYYAKEVEEYKTGVTYDYKSPDFSDALMNCYSDYETYRNNMLKFRENHNIEIYSKVLESIFDKVKL